MDERKTIYLDDALEAIRKLPNAGMHWFVSAEAVFDALLKLPPAQPEPLVNESRTLVNDLVNDTISRQAALDCVTYDVEYTTERIKALPSLQPTCNNLATDCISRQAAIDALDKRFDKIPMEQTTEILELRKDLRGLPSAQPDIKQAAKLLSDFIESCPGGDSYLITPNGEKLRTDWGYAMEGIQLIHDWAERRTDE